MDDKENTAPLSIGRDASAFSFLPVENASKKGRSKSMGPTASFEGLPVKRQTLDRRQSSFTLVKGIIPSKEDAERKAARRKSMAAHRVSFAPEATLHTWDVIDYMREHTTSTESSDPTHPTSSHRQSSSPSSADQESESGESAGDESDTGDEMDIDEDGTSTGMSFDSQNFTQQSAVSGGSSTSSTLDRNLRAAADMAGTRGIEFDEFGDMSMEIAETEITSAFQPWAHQSVGVQQGHVVYEQENVDPRLTAQHTKQALQTSSPGELARAAQLESSPFGDRTMEFTQVVRPATGVLQSAQSSPFAEETMEFTKVIQSQQGVLQIVPSPLPHTPSLKRKSEDSLITTTPQSRKRQSFANRMSFASADENEDMSMELTTVLGGIQALPVIPEAHIETPTEPNTPTTPTYAVVHEKCSTGSARSARSRRETASPARRMSARLNLVPAEPPSPAPPIATPRQSQSSLEVSQLTPIIESPTPRVITRSQYEQPVNSPQRPVQYSAPQSSPFQTVVATSPAPLARRVVHGFSSPAVKMMPSMTDNIRTMSSPRKETLKALTPKKKTPSPYKSPDRVMSSVQRSVPAERIDGSNVKLQDFLDEAGIRFMDLQTSNRRATIAPTPSRLRSLSSSSVEQKSPVAFDEAIISAACTEPELELYKHACNELRRYIDGGRSDIKTLEDNILADTPALIQTYMVSTGQQRAEIDVALREIKANARLRSKEMWYGWRSNLVDDLMKVLQSIAEGLLNDDDVLAKKEALLDDMLPKACGDRDELQAEVAALLSASDSVPEDEREQLDAVRDQLQNAAYSLEAKQQSLQRLQAQLAEQDKETSDLKAKKEACLETIERAEELKAAAEVDAAQSAADLRDSINKLELTSGWRLVSAGSNPPTMTMIYKSELQLFCHPLAFATSTGGMNLPVSLTYTGTSPDTCQRFFVQLLQAYLQIVSQASSTLQSVLTTVSTVWDMARAVVEAVRCMSIESATRAAILSDECLTIDTSILIPITKTKASACVKLLVVAGDEKDAIKLVFGSDIKVVYGVASRLEECKSLFSNAVAGGPGSWAMTLAQVEKLMRTPVSKLPVKGKR